MIYRAHQLKAITDNQYQYIMRQVSKKGWRTKGQISIKSTPAFEGVEDTSLGTKPKWHKKPSNSKG